ncbi:MAG: hypothetical protein M1825_001363 [Sarcosagium campestre]|nr:MAG: hypothetical protein M1825_001363 [Sarcosagium campestre]
MSQSRSPNGKASSPTASPTSVPIAFLDQARALRDQQRHLLEQERVMFEQERAIWDTERRVLVRRVRELELELGRAGKMQAKSSTGNGLSRLSGGGGGSRLGLVRTGSLNGLRSGPRVAEDVGEKFWEGRASRNGSVASRTFSSQPDDTPSTLPSISETGFSSVKRAGSTAVEDTVSPTSGLRRESTQVGNGIDVSLVRKDLDGINLKSSAVSAAIVAKAKPPSPSGSTSAKTQDATKATDAASTGSPIKNNYTKHAGHTPNASLSFSAIDSGSGLATPTQPEHLHRPSLLPDVVLGMNEDDDNDDLSDVDPVLQGPLTLQQDGGNDAHFLDQVDSKLLEEARKDMYALSPQTSTEKGEVEDAPLRPPERETGLKFRRSMNFGSAFGSQKFN